ncbi:MAG: hypothetical protein Edafosvirus20_16 [Edafosvirus sp.]|uniref:Aminoacyl-tRNA synthetase class II (D/K/N) domain-containing protein n=1 Tax=Edafosvirus sp. TaxID=2487765 RepID=A0A3G4ZUN4_9VIRU|nr:MAG: hypothetical protein Edafosvirus20_16 [Edafosvirus sp.]
MSIDLINPSDFDVVSTKFREFFKKKGLVEVAAQHRLSILAACEDPTTISTFDYCGKVWPLPQTSQMWLEYELLTKPNTTGYFCFSTSYRQEANPVMGRHNLIFPMIEFEIPGDMNDLMNFEKELLEHLGFGNKDSFPEGNYLDLCKKYGVSELTHEHEAMMLKEYGPVFFLKNFPETTSPFWNMKRTIDKKNQSSTANKIDVIINGIETIGSAERSCNVDEMKKRFYTISDGQYSKILFSRFGKERVKQELDEFLSHKFICRSGAGIGVTRVISAMKANKLL